MGLELKWCFEPASVDQDNLQILVELEIAEGLLKDLIENPDKCMLPKARRDIIHSGEEYMVIAVHPEGRRGEYGLEIVHKSAKGASLVNSAEVVYN